MTANFLIDTNLWVYLYATATPEKHGPIQEFVANHFSEIVISTQILGELYHVLTRKKLKSEPEAKVVILEMVATFPVLEIDTLKVLQALDITTRYGYSYWDSLVIATALVGHCQAVYTEDMQHGQLIEDQLQIINPYYENRAISSET